MAINGFGIGLALWSEYAEAAPKEGDDRKVDQKRTPEPAPGTVVTEKNCADTKNGGYRCTTTTYVAPAEKAPVINAKPGK